MKDEKEEAETVKEEKEKEPVEKVIELDPVTSFQNLNFVRK